MKEVLEECIGALERGVAVIREYEHQFGTLAPDYGKAWTDMMMARDKLINLRRE